MDTRVKLFWDPGASCNDCCFVCKHSLTFSWKEVVVMVYRIGFKALLMGRMKITTQEVMVPVPTRRVG